jgi:hypothetical protein
MMPAGSNRAAITATSSSAGLVAQSLQRSIFERRS